jgi:hypothetical protein
MLAADICYNPAGAGNNTILSQMREIRRRSSELLPDGAFSQIAGFWCAGPIASR